MHVKPRGFKLHTRAEYSLGIRDRRILQLAFDSLWLFDFFYSDMEPLSKYSSVKLQLSPATRILNENPVSDFFSHFFSTIYTSLPFAVHSVVIFERLAKTWHFYKRRLFNIIFLFDICGDQRNARKSPYLHTLSFKNKHIFESSKDRLYKKYCGNFSNFKIKTFCWSFLSLKNLNLTLIKLYVQCCWSVRSL